MGCCMNVAEIIQILPKYVQALYSDSTLYFSGEETIATPERKALVIRDIKLIQEQLSSLEQVLGQNRLDDSVTLEKMLQERSA
jgi:hypothetical protein